MANPDTTFELLKNVNVTPENVNAVVGQLVDLVDLNASIYNNSMVSLDTWARSVEGRLSALESAAKTLPKTSKAPLVIAVGVGIYVGFHLSRNNKSEENKNG